MRMRLEWKVKRSGAMPSRERSRAGISVSIVVFDEGTICPIRYRFIEAIVTHARRPPAWRSKPQCLQYRPRAGGETGALRRRALERAGGETGRCGVVPWRLPAEIR